MKYIVSKNIPLVTQKLLNDQIATPDASTQRAVRLVLILLAVVLSVGLVALQLRRADPYVRDVLALQGNSVQGQVIFQLNCAGCHGIDADGRVGPSLHHVASRKSRIGLISQVTSGKTPPMPQFQPTPQEMADLLEYLKTL